MFVLAHQLICQMLRKVKAGFVEMFKGKPDKQNLDIINSHTSCSAIASYLTLVDLEIEILSKDLIIMKNIELKSNWFL
ncbi:hypothetical protein T4A_5452 [Trichinella pseudospiralis]|uniref:Uncharacterized protein n=1 Tax=Trichinella pseudospiralis TaxID=6337 RepID=A0A0V1EF02_TRIPS|nr:hypothetical protein T4A_5452 [Trichinella pseudospiralis]KRZ42824.1 hypothetical protein T4C_2133 [Trichinella pseudospiralis]